MASNSPWYSEPQYQQYWQSYQTSTQASQLQQPVNSHNQAQAVSYWRFVPKEFMLNLVKQT